jgi:hypothetical protein
MIELLSPEYASRRRAWSADLIASGDAEDSETTNVGGTVN